MKFGPYDYAARSLSPIACSLSGLGAHAHAKKTPVYKMASSCSSNDYTKYLLAVMVLLVKNKPCH